MQSPLPTLQELTNFYESSFVDGMHQDLAADDTLKRMTAQHAKLLFMYLTRARSPQDDRFDRRSQQNAEQKD